MQWSEFGDGLRAVRGAVRSGHFDEAELRQAGLASRAVEFGRDDRGVRGLLDNVVAFADAGEVDRARHQFDRVVYLAIGVGIPIDTGDFSYSEGVILAADGNDVEAVLRFSVATEAFADERRDQALAYAASRCAWVTDRAAPPLVALRAHRLAARAFSYVTSGLDVDALLQAQHLREVGRKECVVHGWSVAAMMDALPPYLEARDIWLALEQIEEVSELDVEIGQLYCSLGMPDDARRHWEVARDAFVALGQSERASAVGDALTRLEPPTSGIGRSAL